MPLRDVWVDDGLPVFTVCAPQDAFAALQSSSESFVVELFHSANNITRITNKTTLLSEHLRAVHTDVWRGIPPPERKKKKA